MFQETDKFIKALSLCKNDLCLNCNIKQVHVCRFVNMSIENNLCNALICTFFLPFNVDKSCLDKKPPMILVAPRQKTNILLALLQTHKFRGLASNSMDF